jgi:hypothetical protein
MYGDRRLHKIVNSTGKFNSVVVKMLKPVFTFSRSSVTLLKKINKGGKIVYQCESFKPILDPSYISLDNTFNLNLTKCYLFNISIIPY